MADLFVTIATIFSIMSCSYGSFTSAPETPKLVPNSSQNAIASLESMVLELPIPDDGLILDGSSSKGANGAPVYEFHWTNVDFPEGLPPFGMGQTIVTMGEKYTIQFNPERLQEGSYHFELFVVDERGAQSDFATAVVQIKGPLHLSKISECSLNFEQYQD